MLNSANIPNEADVVVVGGGTTGLVVASRLAQADPNLSILVLEQGPDVRDNPQVVNPALFITNIAPGSKTTTIYESEPSEYLGGRSTYVPTGGCLGGGSSVNFQVYVRPQQIDFDAWEFENFQDTDPGIDKSLHGYGGPLSVSNESNAQGALQQDFFKACSDIGIDTVPDIQNFKAANAVGKWNMWVDKRIGIRQNVPHGFLYPVLDACNTGLKVATDTKVARILFDADSKRANAVEYVVDQTDPSTPKAQIVHARKENTLDDLLSGRLTLEEALSLKKSSPDRYILGWNGIDCFGKFRPTDKELETFAPCLKELWEHDFEHRPERPMMLYGFSSGYLGDHSTVEPGTYMTAIPYTAYPYSTGSIHITSRSPFDTPEFVPGYLSHPADVEQLLYGYKIHREIMRRMSHYNGVIEATHPKFPAGSKADYNYVDTLTKEKGFPVPSEDDDVIREFIRQGVSTTWHSMGTCAMKKRDVGGVVDDRLNLYGVQGLKIVDDSICPKNVAANTYATAVAIGEKAATIVAADLGIQI